MEKDIALQVIDAQNRQDISRLQELLSPDFKAFISDWPLPLTKDEYLQGAVMAYSAFSFLTYQVEDVIAEGTKVVLRLLVTGKHTGTYHGMAPTQKLISFQSMVIRQIESGKVLQEWQVNDQWTLWNQIRA